LEDLKIEVTLFSETYLKPHIIIKTGTKAELPWELRKAFLTHLLTYLLFFQLEVTGVCIPIGNTEMLLAKQWSDTDITELSRFKNKSILVGDPNAKHPVWNSRLKTPQT
jgi:cytochrome b561